MTFNLRNLTGKELRERHWTLRGKGFRRGDKPEALSEEEADALFDLQEDQDRLIGWALERVQELEGQIDILKSARADAATIQALVDFVEAFERVAERFDLVQPGIALFRKHAAILSPLEGRIEERRREVASLRASHPDEARKAFEEARKLHREQVAHVTADLDEKS